MRIFKGCMTMIILMFLLLMVAVDYGSRGTMIAFLIILFVAILLHLSRIGEEKWLEKRRERNSDERR